MACSKFELGPLIHVAKYSNHQNGTSHQFVHEKFSFKFILFPGIYMDMDMDNKWNFQRLFSFMFCFWVDNRWTEVKWRLL